MRIEGDKEVCATPFLFKSTVIQNLILDQIVKDIFKYLRLLY